MTTISGTSDPVVGIARMVFDGDGNISGYSSVNFNGLLLGNPVTGKYEVATDCAMNWSCRTIRALSSTSAAALKPVRTGWSFIRQTPARAFAGS